ncbi:MAG TPA: orotate phosphoribosyltransferase [Actinomycetota bacterium]|nr:orotate phosphoribosyltransferase [Actinomycetota bacterium]
MKPEDLMAKLEQYGALMHGHFKLTSGRHSDTYVQKQMILSHPRITATLGKAIAELYAETKFETVLSPAVGAILLGNAVAYAADTRFVFAEREEGGMKLRRGQALHPGERVLVVEDIVTTGGSVAEVIAAAEEAHADVVGVVALVDRTTSAPPFELTSLLRIEARDWTPEECPLCAKGVPFDSPGSRHLS